MIHIGKEAVVCFVVFLVLTIWIYSPEFHVVKAEDKTKFRLGASVPSSAVRGFGKRHGISIDYSYQGGVNFYNYMTKGPGYFAAIAITMGLPGGDWPQLKNFLRGLLDSADADNGRCEIIFVLQGVDYGWEFAWKSSLLEFLEGIGANRKSLRYIFLGGEWSYKNRQLPNDYDKLYSGWSETRTLVQSYGYDLAVPDGKHISQFSQDMRKQIWHWGVRYRAGQLSRNPDISQTTLKQCYDTANWLENPTDVFLECFTMWDTPANIPGTPPYYIYYEKFDAFLHGAADRFDATNGAYPQVVTFEVMPETFNDVEGVDCPYLDWWFGEGKLADTYNLRTSKTEPPIPVSRPHDVPTPPSPFPPYSTTVFWVNAAGDLPPFYVQKGGNFSGAVKATLLNTGGPLSNRIVEIYLVKQAIKQGDFCYYDHPMTYEEYSNKVLVGTITTRADGWGSGTFTAPLEPGRYTVIARVPPTSTEMEGISSFMEYILVADRVYKVEVRTNVKARLNFGPSAYGPPWHNCDPERWVEPNKPVVGNCAQGEWKFIMPSEVTDSQGEKWVFSNWEDGSINPVRTILVNRDLVLEAYYSKPGAKSKIDVYGYVRDDRGYPLEGAFITVKSPVDQVPAVTNSQGGYTVTLSVNGPGDTVVVTASYHGRSGSASSTVPSGTSSMQIDVTVPRASTSISCSVSPSTVTIGGSVTVSGVISPTVEGVTVTLTYTKPNTSSFTRAITTSPNGAYSDNYTPDQLGSYSVTASWSGNEDYKEATSLQASFKVMKNPSSISINLDSTSISIGSALRIGGTLSPPLSNVKVMLSYRVKGGNWVPLKNLTTNPDGQFSYMWTNTPHSEGEYELRASWLGDIYYEGSSCTVLFIVTEIVNPPASDFSIISEEPHFISVSDEPGKNVTITLLAPNFTVTVDPKIVKLYRASGYNTTVTIKVSSMANYTIEPFLKVSGIPEGIKARLDQEALRIQRLDSNSTILVISTGESPPEQGNYSIVIECSYMNVTSNELVTLNVVDRIPTGIRVDAAPTSIQYGDALFIKGLVSPPHSANILVSIMLKNGTEIDMAKFSTDETGEFSLSIRIMLAPDEYVIKVFQEEDIFYFGSAVNLTLRVVKANVIITLNSNSTRISSDEPVFLSGVVTTTKGEPVQNMTLKILISGETGTIMVLAKTNENGKYTAIISQLSIGKYEAVSLIEGNDYYEPAISPPVKIEVIHPVSRTLNDIFYPAISSVLIILILITSLRVIVSSVHEIRGERSYRTKKDKR